MMKAVEDYFVAANVVRTGQIVCGPGVNLWPGCILRGDLATITLARRVNIQDGSIVHTDFDQDMLVEEGVVVGHAVVLHGKRIGPHSLIGIGARLLSGSDIGEECLIAAGSIVTEGKVIPPRSVVMGIPGKVVRAITAEEMARTRRINEHYFELAQRYVRGEIPTLSF